MTNKKYSWPFANSRVEYVVNLIEPSKSDRVLNVGISNIPEIEMAIENRVKECWTIDLDKEKLEKARKYLKKTRLIYGDITKKNELKKYYFDKVIILEVLEHLSNDLDVLKSVSSMMKKGGKIIVSVPNKNLLHMINPVKYTQHKRHYSNKEIVEKLEKSGFKIDHFNLVETWTLLANLYVHLFFKYFLKRTKNFLTFKKKANKSYGQINENGLGIVVRAFKI